MVFIINLSLVCKHLLRLLEKAIVDEFKHYFKDLLELLKSRLLLIEDFCELCGLVSLQDTDYLDIVLNILESSE